MSTIEIVRDGVITDFNAAGIGYFGIAFTAVAGFLHWVTAGPNEAARPTIQVGADSSPIANATSPRTSRVPADRRRIRAAHCAAPPVAQPRCVRIGRTAHGEGGPCPPNSK